MAGENLMKLVSIVGMAGSGKSEVAHFFEKKGYARIRFGDVTDEEIKKRGIRLNEKNERLVREQLRKEYGMAAYARLSISKLDSLLQSTNVIIDGLYSWEEYLLLKERYVDKLVMVAIYSSPGTRYERLAQRPVRPLTKEEAASRDKAEIESLNKGGPIAMADFTLINESSMETLENEIGEVIRRIDG
ncbi:MAG: AAA family ATPase [Chloroflexi bacterium]|nr:AAA family ATPase [Chloroflexota bacterium]